MNKISAAAATFLLSCIALPAESNEPGFYTGGYVGQSQKQSDRAQYEAFGTAIHDFFGYTPTTLQTSFDDTDTGFTLLVGYRFNRYLAIEGAYAKLGQVAYDSKSSGSFAMDAGTLNTNVESETSGFQLSVLGAWPLTSNWEVFGRFGMLFATNRLSVALTVQGDVFAQPGGTRQSDDFSQSSQDTFVGVGVSRRFYDVYDLRLEYQRVFAAGKEVTGGQGDIDVALLGITVTF